MRKLILLPILAFCLSNFAAYSQNRSFPNAIHAKLSVNDYGLIAGSDARIGQGFEFAYFRNIAPALNVGVPLKFGLSKLPGTTGNTLMTSFDLIFRLENMKPEAKLVPFAFAGAGYVLEQFKNGNAQFPFGAGLHFRLSPYAFVSAQAEFRKSLVENRDNIQFSLGYVYLLHQSENMPAKPVDMPNDDDRDGVINDLDKCPNDPGPATALGCPDRDNDGIGDAEDHCPDDAGTLETSGCPDYDKDGLADKDDECPTEAGPWNGCPDTDYDGVPDKSDKCPTEAGSATNMGCPEVKDSDGDGVADAEDMCPDMAGSLAGCPDRDNDGVADKNDPCPDVAGNIAGCPDVDGDGVADRDDYCPDLAGSRTNNGCPEPKSNPDRDGDGVADTEDNCPDTPGTLGGCPDRDSDGVADKDDKCPDVAGRLSGCPDRDGDGVADKDDKCPDAAGPLAGCPDLDSDGVADKDDKCPDVAGKLGGCPDGDGDGIADKDDKCPAVPGSAKNGGCPEVTTDPDSDGDGVSDKNDPCPNKAGKIGGCPDSDGDLVADNIDKCPTVAGPTSNFGCPEVKKEVKERLAYAAKAVQFETAKAILKTESYAILDEIVGIMRDNPAYTLSISGYTDDVGGDEANLELSKARAKACYDYLVFRGIKTERLRHAGFGEARPIADNKTAEGRELNRRVEFELLLD